MPARIEDRRLALTSAAELHALKDDHAGRAAQRSDATELTTSTAIPFEVGCDTIPVEPSGRNHCEHPPEWFI